MKNNELEKLIKNRRTIRKYKDKNVSKKEILRILEAGRWSPSAHNIQPWRFIIIREELLIKKLSELMLKKSHELFSGFNTILSETAKIVTYAPCVIVVYSSNELSNRVKKFEEPYFSVTKNSEIQSVAASIENILLMAQSLGVGVAWLTSPLFCENEIMSLLNARGSLVALLTIGYASQDRAGSSRKSLKSLLKFY